MQVDEEYYGQSRVCSMTPTEFELHCMEILRGYAEEEKLPAFKIGHDVKLTASDGTYQIDVYATYTALGAEMKVLAECKQFSSAVKRDYVVLLADKIRSLGAQKGILLSTAGFQSGAIQFAEKHGIALIQVFDTRVNWYSHSSGPDAEIQEDDPFTYGERHLPVFQAHLIKPDVEYQRSVYPTRAMVEKVQKEVDILFQKKYGRKAFQTTDEDSGKENT